MTRRTRVVLGLGAALTATALLATSCAASTSTGSPTNPGTVSTRTVTRAARAAVPTRPSAAVVRTVTVAAVGDISPHALGAQGRTARLAASWRPSAVLALGDLQYPSGALSDFRTYYDPTWGRLKSVTRPVPGNHEFKTPKAAGYYGYFGLRSHPQGHSYYSFNVNGWHVVALNSEIRHGPTSAQLTWLRGDLSRNTQRCVLAYFHQPRFSSGTEHGSNPGMAPFWDALYAKRADLILNGHEHNYERFARMTPSGRASAGGIREIVVGTGGAEHYAFDRPVAHSLVRIGSRYGVLKLGLRPTGYSWVFTSVDGVTRDSGTGSCH